MAANPQSPLENAPETLAERIESGPLSHADSIRFAIALAESLREVHRQGRVYGLLQPDRIAVIEGQVRLLPASPVALTPYFSPEQVAGQDLDSRSDIFSLGAVMYEMFSGRRAFRATSKPALRMEILNRDSAALEDLPPALSRLIQRCLEKKPERRIQRLEILLAELKLQLARETPPAPEPPTEHSKPLVLATRPMLPEPAVTIPTLPVEPTSPREKLKVACPICGARDVHASRPRGALELALGKLGSIGRCYRCYYRFLRLGAFSFKA
jgi:serine/threonine protein kinase